MALLDMTAEEGKTKTGNEMREREMLTCSKAPQVGFEPWASVLWTQPLFHQLSLKSAALVEKNKRAQSYKMTRVINTGVP